MNGPLAPLRVQGFGRLFVAYTVNELGDSLGAVALAFLVYNETGSALATTGLFVAAKFLPAFVAPALTAITDQLAITRSLPLLYALEAVIFALLALVADAFFLPAVIVLALADGTLALTARALLRSAAVLILEPVDQLRAGNGLLNIGFSVSAAAGPAIGGLVVAGAGVSTALLLDAASFFIIAILLARARGLPQAELEREPWRTRVRDGLAYVRSNRPLRILIGAQAAAFVFFALILPIEVVYAQQSLGAGAGGFGALLASWGFGMVLGSILYAAVRRTSSLTLIGTSTLAVAAAYLGMAGAQTLLAACVLSVLGGVGNGIQWVAVITAIQERTADGYQARVIGLLESAAAAMPGVGFVLGGLLTAIFSPRAAYATAGIGILLVLAVGTVLVRGSATEDDPPLPPMERDDGIPSRVEPPPLEPATALARREATQRANEPEPG